jgi:hypothetical protein
VQQVRTYVDCIHYNNKAQLLLLILHRFIIGWSTVYCAVFDVTLTVLDTIVQFSAGVLL